MPITFDWDPSKDALNDAKHGYEFLDVLDAFNDPSAIREDVTKPEYGEQRFRLIGEVNGTCLSIIYTDRNDSHDSSQPGALDVTNAGDIVRVRLEADGRRIQLMPDGSEREVVGSTDWDRVNSMTEEEIEANALSDPDNPPITEEELARMRRSPNPKAIRVRLHLSQEQFAEQFEVPLGTLRDWEQGVTRPDSAARTLLRIIDADPEAVLRALAASYR